ncbi:MAG TPA: hypothetical protein VFG86_11885 [Chloroflexota bacterium]|jgi:hypothetical protein|nr:hypothetical protein [Chloroflexota bacterium]
MQSAGIFGSAVLEVAIGVIFLYFVLSVICSAATELVASVLSWRARDLERAMQDLLGTSDLYVSVAAHPLITAMGHNEGGSKQQAGSPLKGRPAYIPSHTFRVAFLDAVANRGLQPGQDGIPANVEQLKAGIKNLVKPDERRVGQALMTLIEDSRDPRALAARVDRLKEAAAKLPARADDTETLRLLNLALAPCGTLDEFDRALENIPGADLQVVEAARKLVTTTRAELQELGYDVQKLQTNVEAWFDNAMDRMSGHYKRRVQLFLLVIGAVVVICTGADTLRFATTLFANPTLRAELASSAQAQTTESPTVTEAVNQLTTFSLLFGYGDIPAPQPTSRTPEQATLWLFWTEKVFGLAATTLAIIMGAPSGSSCCRSWSTCAERAPSRGAAQAHPARPEGSPGRR